MISIIVPSFNRASVLARALHSVSAQTYSDWELIWVDDGSTDESEKIFTAWRKSQTQPTRHLRLVQNCGVSRARNQGAAQAQGEWLAFLDSDDEWLPKKLAQQLELAPHFPFIHGEEIWIRNGVRVNAGKKHAKGGGRQFARCVQLCCISPSTSMIRTELFRGLNGFREDFVVCEDYELWLRISAQHEVGFVAEPVAKKYAGHEDQLSMRYPAMDYFRAKALVPFLNAPQISADERELARQTLAKKCEILLRGYAKRGIHNPEVEDWRRKAESANHSAHSVTERRPRSLSSFT